MHAESYFPLTILNNSIISPRYRLYLSVGKFKDFNRSLYDFLDNSGISLVAKGLVVSPLPDPRVYL